jgi:hypothetical protein
MLLRDAARKAHSATARIANEMMPTTMPGVIPPNGKPNPVTLVAMDVQRKIWFQRPRGLFATISNTAMKPAAIAMRLMMT